MVSAIDNYNFDNTEKLNEDFYNAQVEATKILGEYERLLHIFEERKSGKKEVVKQDILKIENVYETVIYYKRILANKKTN